jgi:hypothetical protein
MRENRTSGTVAGAPGNRSPYAGGVEIAYLDQFICRRHEIRMEYQEG